MKHIKVEGVGWSPGAGKSAALGLGKFSFSVRRDLNSGVLWCVLVCRSGTTLVQAAPSPRTQAAASPALYLPGCFLLIFCFVVFVLRARKLKKHRTMSNNECLDHLPSATSGCACASGKDVADASGSCTHFPPCTMQDLSWEVLLGERDTFRPPCWWLERPNPV